MQHLGDQLDEVIAIEAIFCEPGEFQLLSHSSVDVIDSLPIEFCLNIRVVPDTELFVTLHVALHKSTEMYIKCPFWMDRKSLEQLQSNLPNDVLEAVEYIKEQAQEYLPRQIEPLKAGVTETHIDLKRIWFYLVSLSTKSKREDMVNWASEYSLTGFVMAGKPGILCVEGDCRKIDSYLAEIKSRSWADVPSHQKKISVVLEESIRKRKFDSMVEITNLFTMGGHLNNRPDMGQVKAWFESHGLRYAFSKVVQLH